MAKAIIVSQGVVVSLSTFGFFYLTDKIRKEFLPEQAAIVENIFKPHDEEGMPFISLKDVGVEEFGAFVEAAKRADFVAKKDDNYNELEKLWTELFDYLSEDDRFFDK